MEHRPTPTGSEVPVLRDHPRPIGPRTPKHQRHLADQAARFGHHTFVATRVDDNPLLNVWRCLGCHGAVTGDQLIDGWADELGFTCPALSMVLSEPLLIIEEQGPYDDEHHDRHDHL